MFVLYIIAVVSPCCISRLDVVKQYLSLSSVATVSVYGVAGAIITHCLLQLAFSESENLLSVNIDVTNSR